jgi:TRAP-type mannitol/chloroaromatic compound transport system permease small subunit
MSDVSTKIPKSSKSILFDIIPKGIDAFSRKEGEIGALLIVPLTVVVIYEVIMRYVFDAPTIWGFELTAFLYGIHYMLGLSYTQVHGGHVKVDVLITRFSTRTQAIINIITNLGIFIPVMSLLTIWSFKYAYTSTVELEHNSTSWAPPIYPLKIIMALSFLFLFIQGVSDLLKEIRTLRASFRE